MKRYFGFPSALLDDLRNKLSVYEQLLSVFFETANNNSMYIKFILQFDDFTQQQIGFLLRVHKAIVVVPDDDMGGYRGGLERPPYNSGGWSESANLQGTDQLYAITSVGFDYGGIKRATGYDLQKYAFVCLHIFAERL